MKTFARRAIFTGLGLSAGLAASVPALAQAKPTATRPIAYLFRLPTVSGSLQYSLTASELLTFGYNGYGGPNSATNLSADVAYISPSVTKPFSLVYGGGYLASTGAQPSSFFHHLTLSQLVNTRHWVFAVADDLSYLPQTGTTGLTGLSGIGDTGIPITGTQGILTQYATRVDNRTTGSVSRKLTGSTLVNGSASYSLDRFLDVPTALESDGQTYSGGVTHRLDARTSVDGTATYAKFVFLGYPGQFTTQGVSVQYVRQLTRKFKVDLAAGPQRIDSFSLTGTPASLSYTANLNVQYLGLNKTGDANYSRSTNSGSGVTLGATTDTVRATGTRPLTRDSVLSASLSYARTQSLSRSTFNSLNSQSFIASVQGNRALRTDLSVYLSYSLQRQSITGLDLSGLTTQGISHVVGFGMTFSPRTIRFGN